jgi:hypothetical protein
VNHNIRSYLIHRQHQIIDLLCVDTERASLFFDKRADRRKLCDIGCDTERKRVAHTNFLIRVGHFSPARRKMIDTKTKSTIIDIAE